MLQKIYISNNFKKAYFFSSLNPEKVSTKLFSNTEKIIRNQHISMVNEGSCDTED